MAESKRHEAAAPEPEDHDGRAESLLVEGLDRYFNGRYEDAIHIWTRVLFFDRAHARARAYIDRARTAIGERQRRADEMVQASHDMIDQGRTDAARHLLSEVTAESGDDERVSALRVRLERVERVERARSSRRSTASPTTLPGPEAVPGWTWPQRSWAAAAWLTAAAGVALMLAALTSPALEQWAGLGPDPEPAEVVATPEVLPVLSSADVALVRARHLKDRGRLAEALQALDRIEPGGGTRSDIDSLRVEIQQLLLASAPDHPRVARGESR